MAVPAKLPATTIENPAGATVVPFPVKKRKGPAIEEILALQGTMTQEQMAIHFGCCVKTIGNRLRKYRQERGRGEGIRQAAGIAA